MTVLQGDLVSFSRLAEVLSPEEVKGLLDAVYTALTREILAQGGMVHSFIGDAVVAFFGVPNARGDDPRRAVEAGLALHRALETIGRRLSEERGLGLSMRVGVDTGPAVVSAAAGSRRHSVTGPVMASVVELEGAAPPGGVLIGARTWRQIRGSYRTRRFVDPGFDEASKREAYLVDGRAELMPAASHAEPALVGRELELAQLAALVERAVDGQRVVCVQLSGPAGIGKTHLLRALLRLIAKRTPQAPLVFKGASPPPGRGGVVDLVAQWIRSMARGGAATEVERDDIAQLLSGASSRVDDPRVAISAGERVDLLCHLVGLSAAPSGTMLELLQDPARLRRRTVQVVASLFETLASQAPLVLVGEDHQWCRPSTDALIDEVLGQLTAPVLYVQVLRTPEQGGEPWQGAATLERHEMRLAPLSRVGGLALLRESLVGLDGLPEETTSLLLDAAEGNPRFITEMVRHLGEPARLGGVLSDATPQPAVDTLRQLVQARLDRLPEVERHVLRTAAVVGMNFWDELLVRLGIPEPGPLLESLTIRGLIRPRRMSAIEGAGEFVFSSDAVREVAYDNVLLKVKRFLHQVTASWLEDRLGERRLEFAETLAYHHLEGGAPLAAVGYLSHAARRARGLYANDDARLLIERALGILSRVDAEDARSLEAELETSMAEILSDRGEVDAAMERLNRALALRQSHGSEALARAHLLMRIGELHVHRSRVETALERFFAARAELVAAPDADERVRLLQAEIAKARGWALSRLGRREEAQASFEEGLRHVGEQVEAELAISARLHSALGLLARLRGAPTEALERHGHALKLARRTSNLELRCVCLVNWGAVLMDLRLFGQARSCYAEALEVQERIGKEEDAAISRINLAQVSLERGDLVEARALGLAARERLEVFGTHWALPELYRILAQLEMLEGHPGAARNLALLAVSMGEQVEHHYYIGGAHRLLGDLAAQRGDLEEASAHYKVALERLEEVGEPRELARALLHRASLDMKRVKLSAEQLQAQLGRVRELMAAYPEDPIHAEVDALWPRREAP